MQIYRFPSGGGPSPPPRDAAGPGGGPWPADEADQAPQAQSGREALVRGLLGGLLALGLAWPHTSPWWALGAFAAASLVWTGGVYSFSLRAASGSDRGTAWATLAAAAGDGLLLGLGLALGGPHPVIFGVAAAAAFGHGLRDGWRGGLVAVAAPLVASAFLALLRSADVALTAEAALALLVACLSGGILARAKPETVTTEATAIPDWEEILSTLAPALAALDPQILATEAALASRRLTGGSGAVVGLLEQDEGEIRLAAEGDWPAEPLAGRTLGARAIATGAPQRSRAGVGVGGLPPWALGLPARDFWALPLVVAGDGLGVLYLWDEEESPALASGVSWFLPAVGLLAVSLRNARRFEELRSLAAAPSASTSAGPVAETVAHAPVSLLGERTDNTPAAPEPPLRPAFDSPRLTVRRPARQELLVGELRIDGPHAQVTLRGRPIACSPLEFELLYTLAERAGTALSQEELLGRVWGEGYPGDIGVVEVAIHRLRRRLQDGRNGPPRVVTVRGEGYMLVDPRRFPYSAFRAGAAVGR